jgi:hypothetical protein
MVTDSEGCWKEDESKLNEAMKCTILVFKCVVENEKQAEDSWNINPLNAELNPICHLLALLGGATIVDVRRLRVNRRNSY